MARQDGEPLIVKPKAATHVTGLGKARKII